jgi:hypothetical protein
VITANLKGYQNTSGSLSELSEAAKKGWFDDVTHVIASVLPAVINATKDIKPAGLSPSKGFQVPSADDKGFWDTFAQVAQVAVPIALSVL